MSTTLLPFAAVIAVAAVAVALPATMKAFGGAILTHSATGLYEFTLDDPCNGAECIAIATPIGATADTNCEVEHVSDTVKRIRTFAAGALADTVGFNATFTRMPGGH